MKDMCQFGDVPRYRKYAASIWEDVVNQICIMASQEAGCRTYLEAVHIEVGQALVVADYGNPAVTNAT
jgi:hypothetical protein